MVIVNCLIKNLFLQFLRILRILLCWYYRPIFFLVFQVLTTIWMSRPLLDTTQKFRVNWRLTQKPIMHIWFYGGSKIFLEHRSIGEKWELSDATIQYEAANTKFRVDTIFLVLRGWVKKIRQAQNLANSKKSTILLQSLWNLVKIIILWVDFVARISAWSD